MQMKVYIRFRFPCNAVFIHPFRDGIEEPSLLLLVQWDGIGGKGQTLTFR